MTVISLSAPPILRFERLDGVLSIRHAPTECRRREFVVVINGTRRLARQDAVVNRMTGSGTSRAGLPDVPDLPRRNPQYHVERNLPPATRVLDLDRWKLYPLHVVLGFSPAGCLLFRHFGSFHSPAREGGAACFAIFPQLPVPLLNRKRRLDTTEVDYCSPPDRFVKLPFFT
jgi:hypothetical protein